MKPKYEICNDLQAGPVSARSARTGRRKYLVVYTIWDREAKRQVSPKLE
jgi:hypothetical protein